MAYMDIARDRLYWQKGTEKILIEPWGLDGLRVRVTHTAKFDEEKIQALLPQATPAGVKTQTLETGPRNFAQDAARLGQGEYHVAENPQKAKNALRIENGGIVATIDRHGYLSFARPDGQVLLEEYVRNRSDLSEFCVPLGLKARDLRPVPGGDYRATLSFEAHEDEKFFGLGQYQEDLLDLKGCCLELAQRNSQASIPFLVSSRGYGFLWNNPAIGQVALHDNVTEWTAEKTREIDYYICAGDRPADILRRYADATGHAPMMDRDLMGFWQCKLRYRTQDEVLAVAREYKRRQLPLDVIVIDFFHWTAQGDWKFNPQDFPDPKGLVEKLRSMGIRLMVSIWPTVDSRSENFAKMSERGYLLQRDRGLAILNTWMGPTTYYDTTHPGARDFVWQKVRGNYYDKGIDLFWLDEAEPELDIDEADNLRYHAGPALSCANAYPKAYSQGFYEGMTQAGEKDPLHLVRCAWAGSQRFGALLWSGDIESSFKAMRIQLKAGLNAGMAGIPWWTCDIGGFLGGFTEHEDFRDLLVRWFQWGTFLPIMRLHGNRLPYEKPAQKFRDGIEQFGTGADNELWSFGEENVPILEKFLRLRESLKPYIERQMQAAHEEGLPVMRPLFLEFPEDPACWAIEDQYLFGDQILVAPILQEGAREREVYLPQGENWREVATGKMHAGGKTLTASAPLDTLPLFARQDAKLPI